MKTTGSQAILARFCKNRKELYTENGNIYRMMCNDLCPYDFDIDCPNVTAKDWAIVDEYEEKVWDKE